MLFGPHPSFEPLHFRGKHVDTALASRLDESFLRARESELIRRMGKFLFFLQGVFNFTVRCQKLTKNIVCQIAGCYNGDIPFLSQNVDLIPLGETLATLLRLLITIDTAIYSNSDLLEAWGLFKAAVKEKSTNSFKVCRSNPFKLTQSQYEIIFIFVIKTLQNICGVELVCYQLRRATLQTLA